MGEVYYHHPADKQLSLDFVNPNSEDVTDRLSEYPADVELRIMKYDFDREFYVVYTTRDGGGAVKNLDLNLRAEIESMTAEDGTIVARLLEIYVALIRENEREEGLPVEAYKDIDVTALPDVLGRTDWIGTATEVAGRFASNLILKHALPNANHRTAVAMMEFYLRHVDDDFSMPVTTVETDPESYDWRQWVNSYINESKRLLTIRRKNVKIKYVRAFGGTELVRKHGLRIPLSEYELDMHPSEAKCQYAKKHERLWTEFAEVAVERAGNSALKSQTGTTKREFAEKIRNLD